MSFLVCVTLHGFRGLAVRMYVEGLSLRRVAKVLGELGFRVSYESVRRWFHKTGDLFHAAHRLKRRIKQFYCCFPTYSPKVSERWIKAWVALS
ncbi:MAG: hypothetical protein QW506_02580 [Thermoproteota archaeon]